MKEGSKFKIFRIVIRYKISLPSKTALPCLEAQEISYNNEFLKSLVRGVA